MVRRNLLFLFVFILSQISIAQNPRKPSSSEIYHDLLKLNFFGTALYVAAHPDDENTKFISYLSNALHANTAYLSITRGDGGQNLIGSELGDLLGVIRTDELLEARKIDGGEQYFTRAKDFGFSKNPEETFEFWDKEKILEDVVYIIRKLKPDVIINRFDHRSPGTTHGHHTASAILSLDAFDLANNPNKFPSSANKYGVWQPKRIFFNTSWWFYGSQEKFDQADKRDLTAIETGIFFPTLGLSNGEIAALSRSQHRSQGFGSTGTRGNDIEYLEFLKGSPLKTDNIFEGINTSWTRIKGRKKIEKILKPLEKNFDFKNPSTLVPELIKAYSLIKKLEDLHWREIKMKQIEKLILDCSGIFIEAVAKEENTFPNSDYEVTVEAINRGGNNVELTAVKDDKNRMLWDNKIVLLPNIKNSIDLKLTSSSEYTTPYWLREKGDLGMFDTPDHLNGFPHEPGKERINFILEFGPEKIEFSKDIIFKLNDPVYGEIYKPFEVIPEVTTAIPEKVLMFSDSKKKVVEVVIRSGKEKISGKVSLEHPEGWRVSPEFHSFELNGKQTSKTVLFEITPPEFSSEGFLRAVVHSENKKFDKELQRINYEHIPQRSILFPSQARIVKMNLNKRGKKIGYLHGAGDAVPESIKQMGYDVTILSPASISPENLKDFNAVVLGIRAYNTIPELAQLQPVLNNYVEEGGNLIVQYNTSMNLITRDLSPYPLKISRDRVTDESSDVTFLAPEHPVLNFPNKITKKDFEGWVQERGLYFPDEWSKEFIAVLGMNDKGEDQLEGSLLIAKHGKGYYVYTGLSFFRELPAGVPGAYRIFANLLSLGKED